MDSGEPKGVIPLWHRILGVLEDPFLVALSQLEEFTDALCLAAHYEFLLNRDPYEKGRADAYTDILAYIALVREARKG